MLYVIFECHLYGSASGRRFDSGEKLSVKKLNEALMKKAWL